MTSPTIRLDAISIVATDVAASLTFYRMLGLPIPDGAETEEHVECTLDSGLRLLWDSAANVQSFDPTWSRPQGGPAMSLAFLCDSPTQVDATHAALVSAGYESHTDPWDAFWGQRYATVRDPDGNSVDLFAPLG